MAPNLSDRTLLLSGIALCVLAAWFTIGYHHPDEHFQIWEFANYKLGNIPAADLPWEFPAQMRPGLQPFLAYSTVLVAQKLGIENPFLHIFITRLICGLAGLWVSWKWFLWLERDLKSPDAARWMRIGLLFFWFMPYLNVRFSSENTSAICFFGGLLLLLQQIEQQKGRFSVKLVAAGLLLGFSFFFRYQIAFAGIGLVAWLLFEKRLSLSSWAALFVGVLGASVMGFAADCWLYGDWICPPYNYFVTNILHSEAKFGTEPWWWYFENTFIALLPPLSLVLLFFFAIGIWQKPRHVLTWCLVPFILAHIAVEHKEMRFLFPMILPFFFLVVVGWEYFRENYGVKNWMQKVLRVSLWINVPLVIFWTFTPAKGLVAYPYFLWDWFKKNPTSTVYFVKSEPRKHYPLNMPFYENPAQKQVSWYTDSRYQNDTSALRAGDLMFFSDYLSPAPVPLPGFRFDRIYAYYPNWALAYDINGWQSRTRMWVVYELKKE